MVLTGIPQMASPGCRRWQHKGRTSTNPALNRYARSRSALYRADMAMGNPAQWSFHAPRAHPGLGSAHLSCRATWMLMVGPPSWRQGGRSQPIDEAEDFPEQLPWHRHLRRSEGDVSSMANHLRTDLHQLFPQRARRPFNVGYWLQADIPRGSAERRSLTPSRPERGSYPVNVLLTASRQPS